ncbi:MAG: helix-turn-helix domain-containing protein [Phycisphaerae bacterium]|nr:helix-turn-helix domain-containing protein [Phycisphaerae bacterium]
MAPTPELTDIVTSEHFGRVERSFRRHFGLGLEMMHLDGGDVQRMCSADCNPRFCKLIRRTADGGERCRQDRIAALGISIQTGQPHITLCHAGIVYCCVPVMDGDVPLGGVFFGKCLWQEPAEELGEDICTRLENLGIGRQAIIEAAQALTVISGRTIHRAAEFLFNLLYEVTELEPDAITRRRARSQQQAAISECIQLNKYNPAMPGHYPYETECELVSKVRIGDGIGAAKILSALVGAIMVQNPGDIHVLKARLVELLSLLSRAAVEGGVDLRLVLEKNVESINRVLGIDRQEDLCVWIGRAVNDFIESVYMSQDAAKVTQIRPAIDFIEMHYAEPLTLTRIARAAYLSVSRLAHLFKEQMGITVIDYLTHVRIGHARRLLLTTEKSCSKISFEVGYNNQSYFTRTFKETVGMTPRQFREKNRRQEGRDLKELATA